MEMSTPRLPCERSHTIVQVFCIDVDDVVRTKSARDVEARPVARQSGHNHAIRAGGLGGDHTGQALLTGSLDQNHFARAGAAVQIGPLDAVAGGQTHCRKFGRHVVGNLVKYGIRVQILILAIAAPQSRLFRNRSGAIAECARTPRLGLIAQPKFT